LPARFNIFFPIAIYGSILYFNRSFKNNGKSIYDKEKGWNCTGKTKGYIPYLLIYIAVILTYLTKIAHKEPKFLLPIFPPIFLLIGFGI
jgi:Na+/H+ antiporter NhaC